MLFTLLLHIFFPIHSGVISSLQEQASKAEHVPTVYVDWAACLPKDTEQLPTQPIEVRYHDPEEEIALGMSKSPPPSQGGLCAATDYYRLTQIDPMQGKERGGEAVHAGITYR